MEIDGEERERERELRVERKKKSHGRLCSGGFSGPLALCCEDEEEEVKSGRGGCKITCRARAAK